MDTPDRAKAPPALGDQAAVKRAASLKAQLWRKAEKETEEAGEGEAGGTATVTVVGEGESAAASGSRPGGYSGARSELVRISPAGRVESIWRFSDETAYDLLWHRDRLWVATGQEGKLYSFRDGDMVLEKDVDERQIVALLADDPGPAFATTNAAAVYRVSSESERRGAFTSPADIGRFANVAPERGVDVWSLAGGYRWDGNGYSATSVDATRLRVPGVDAVQLFDTWGGILHPADYARVVLPCVKRIMDGLKTLGVPRIYFLKGSAPYLDLVTTLDVEALGMDWTMDMARTLPRVEGYAVQGNLDPLLLLSDPETIQL